MQMRTSSSSSIPPLSQGAHLQRPALQWPRIPHARSEGSVAAEEVSAFIDEDCLPITGCVSALAAPVLVGAVFRAGLAEFGRLLQQAGDASFEMALLYPQPEAFRSMADIEVLPDVVASLPVGPRASEDEIEACGYMGWLTCASRNA